MSLREALESQAKRRTTDWRITTDIYGDDGMHTVAQHLLEELFDGETSVESITGSYTIVIERQEIRGRDVFSLRASKVNVVDAEDREEELPDPVDMGKLLSILRRMATAWPQRAETRADIGVAIAERDLVRRWLRAVYIMDELVHDDDGSP